MGHLKHRVKTILKKIKHHRGPIFVVGMLLALSAVIVFKEAQERRSVSLPNVQAGPWGEMLVWDIQIQQPEEYVSFYRLSSNGPCWHFGPVGTNTVGDILSSAGCPPEEVQELLASSSSQNGDFIIRPCEKILLRITPKTRASLYLKLAENKKNFYQANPITVPGGDFTQLLHGKIRNPGRIKEMYQKLSYERNGFHYFSDPEIILQTLGQDVSQREAFLKYLTTVKAVMASILVKPDTAIDLPVIYWGLPSPGVKVKDLYPLFEAQKSMSAGGAVPISYLLPPKARDALYKTPSDSSSEATPQNCHMTALNFFSPNPDPRVSDLKFAGQYLSENYYEIGKPTLCGDLVLLLNPQNHVIHTAVHLAGDIDYCKLGNSIGQPWVLMHEKDMVGMYSSLEPMHVAYMRWNDR